jgi:hypothetical protein
MNKFFSANIRGLSAKVLSAAAALLILVSCAKKSGEIPGDSGGMELPRLGMDLPPGFNPLGGEELTALVQNSLTSLELEPFTVSPLYGFTKEDGQGTLIVSALKPTAPEAGDPLSAVYAYQRSLEDFFQAGRISYEEIPGKAGGLLLMVMSFGEGEDGAVLSKGLYYSPEQFFMLDLYTRRAAVTEEDARNYQTLFLSLVP